MDGFTDTLSQHFASPQDMIAANGQADAEEMLSLKEQVDKYEGVLDRFNETVDSLDRKISEIKPVENTAPSTEEYTSKLSGVEGKLQDHIHKENVRVYRNVQASVVDELAKQTDTLTSRIDNLDAKLASQDEKLNQLGSIITQNSEAVGAKAQKAGKGKAVLPLQIIILVALLADIAFNVLVYLGIL